MSHVHGSVDVVCAQIDEPGVPLSSVVIAVTGLIHKVVKAVVVGTNIRLVGSLKFEPNENASPAKIPIISNISLALILFIKLFLVTD